MQSLHDNGGAIRKPFGLGWKAVFFSLFVIAVSLAISVGVVQLLEPLLA